MMSRLAVLSFITFISVGCYPQSISRLCAEDFDEYSLKTDDIETTITLRISVPQY